MPLRDTTGFGERVPREMIEADFEVAFNFVEMAKSESSDGNRELATQLLQKADGLLQDIRQRLRRMSASQRAEYDPRCERLSDAISDAGGPSLQIGE